MTYYFPEQIEKVKERTDFKLTPVSEEEKESLEQAALAWERYAETAYPSAEKTTSLRCADTLRFKAETGVAVCTCCFKPYGAKDGVGVGKHPGRVNRYCKSLPITRLTTTSPTPADSGHNK